MSAAAMLHNHGDGQAHASVLEVLALLTLAVAIRLFFYTGFFGSDEVTYMASALKIAGGDLTPSTYIGAIRYGHQYPIAAFAALFGSSEFTLNLWPFLCSIAEIGLVASLGSRMVGPRAALIAGLILAVLPLHVHYAGRIMADAPLALCITASFLLFWHGQQTDSAPMFVLGGLAAGLSFWVKEVTAIYLFVFLAYPLLFRCWNWKWIWMLAGFTLMVGANMLLFFLLTNDPLYVINIIRSTTADYVSSAGRFAKETTDSPPTYYLEYLFLKIYHTWLLGLLAVAGLVRLWLVRSETTGHGLRFVALWGLGMLTLFSLLPVSLHPIKLISKQVNYMLMFAAPLALLAAIFIARLRGVALILMLALLVLPSLALDALERNTVAVFTANSKGAVELARNIQTNGSVYGSVRAEMAADFANMVNSKAAPVQIFSLADLLDGRISPQEGKGIVAIVDPPSVALPHPLLAVGVPPCWQPLGALQPVVETRWGDMFMSLANAASLLPASVESKVSGKLTELLSPATAQLYRIPGERGIHCADS